MKNKCSALRLPNMQHATGNGQRDATRVDWLKLFRFLVRTMTARGWQLACAQDFASEAIARTYGWFVGSSNQRVGVVWRFAMTTCRRLGATERRCSAARRVYTNIEDGAAIPTAMVRVVEGASACGAAVLLNQFERCCRGTRRTLVQILRVRSATNAELAHELGISTRAIEKALQAIRREARIFAGRFGPVRLLS